MPNRMDIITEARTWIGTPFRHQGRLKNVGVDCIGLIICVCRDLGLSEYDISGYGRVPHGTALKDGCDEQLNEIPIPDAAPGDVLLLRIGTEPRHMAIIGVYPSGESSIIHALATGASKKVVEHILDQSWRNHIVSAYSIPGIVP